MLSLAAAVLFLAATSTNEPAAAPPDARNSALFPGDVVPPNLPAAVPLWEGPAPLSHGTGPLDTPTLTPFLPEGATSPGPAIVICPGGGYAGLSMVYEGYKEANWFQQHGVAAFVLQYRLPAKGYRHPVPLLDAQRAVRLVRSRAAEWNVDPKRVGVMGFSAGGHLAATLETHFETPAAPPTDAVDQESCRPDYAVLVYAVITFESNQAHQGSKLNLLGLNPSPELVHNLSAETQVTAQTPPTLLVAVDDDKTVPVENSRMMYAALQKAGVDSAFQEYPTGGHGFGFQRPVDTSPHGWLDRVGDWLEARHFLP